MPIKNFNMKTLFISLLFLFTAVILNAQEWQTDYNTALNQAKNENKNIILVFSGSDWCAPCIKLEKEILNSEDFKNYASENFVLLKAEFPRKKKNKLSEEQQEKNNQLAEKYNKQGYFPCVVVLDAAGKVKGVTGYKNISPKEYIKILTSF